MLKRAGISTWSGKRKTLSRSLTLVAQSIVPQPHRHDAVCWLLFQHCPGLGLCRPVLAEDGLAGTHAVHVLGECGSGAPWPTAVAGSCRAYHPTAARPQRSRRRLNPRTPVPMRNSALYTDSDDASGSSCLLQPCTLETTATVARKSPSTYCCGSARRGKTGAAGPCGQLHLTVVIVLPLPARSTWWPTANAVLRALAIPAGIAAASRATAFTGSCPGERGTRTQS